MCSVELFLKRIFHLKCRILSSHSQDLKVIKLKLNAYIPLALQSISKYTINGFWINFFLLKEETYKSFEENINSNDTCRARSH